MKTTSEKYPHQFTVLLTEEQYTFLADLSKRDDVTPSWIIRRALDNYMHQGVSVDPSYTPNRIKPILHVDDPALSPPRFVEVEGDPTAHERKL